MRILGLDYGDKTIGVAISDPLCVTAGGVEIIRRADEAAIKKSIARLSEIIKEYSVERIILGYPKNMDNTEGIRCTKTKDFKARLERNFKNLPVVLWDERLSTVSAEAVLREGGLSGKKIKQSVDKMAAVFILQNYLDYMKRGASMKNPETFGENDGFDEIDDELDDDIDTVVMQDDEGNEIVFAILDGVEYNGVTYLLVIEDESVDDEEAEASILKEVCEDGEDAIYEFVEDEEEFNMAAQLFRNSGDEYEIH